MRSAALIALAAVDAASYSLIAPVLPAISRQLHAAPALVGTLAATFSAAMIVGFLVAGRTVARASTTRILAGSLVLMAAGTVVFVLSGGWAGYLAARATMGLASGGLWIAIAFATLEGRVGSEYVAMSRVNAAYSAGALLGPALGAVGGIHRPFLAYLGLVLLGLVAATRVTSVEGAPRFAADRSALRRPGFGVASAGIALAMLATGVVDGVLPLHLGTRMSQAQIAAAYTVMSLVVAAAAVGAGWVRPARALLGSSVLVVAGLAFTGATDAVPGWLVALGVAAVGIGLAETGAMGVLIETVDPARIVTAMVVWSQLAMSGYLLGPLVGGALAQWLGFGAVALVPLAAAVAVLVLYARARGPRARGPRTADA